jgi:hypothetical protein
MTFLIQLKLRVEYGLACADISSWGCHWSSRRALHLNNNSVFSFELSDAVSIETSHMELFVKLELR